MVLKSHGTAVSKSKNGIRRIRKGPRDTPIEKVVADQRLARPIPLPAAAWDLRQYEGRKVLVRLDEAGEPCSYDDCKYPNFGSFFFVCWRSFDESNRHEYAECTTYLLPSREVTERESGCTCSGTHRQRNNNFMMIPAQSVFFVNYDVAKDVGLDPHPNQAAFFPEHLTDIPPAIGQPSNKKPPTAYPPGERVIMPNRPTCRLAIDSLRKASVLGKGIEIRMSRIPESGRGVFATRDFETNELITLYFGHFFGEAQRVWMQQCNLGSHAKPLQFKHTYLDGVKVALTGMHAAQLLNQGSPVFQNCDWVTVDVYPSSGEKVMAIKAIRPIYAGEELYVCYGQKFWDEQVEHPRDPPPVVLPKRTR